MPRLCVHLALTDAECAPWNMGLWPVRPAGIFPAASHPAGNKPAGHTDWKSMFRYFSFA